MTIPGWLDTHLKDLPRRLEATPQVTPAFREGTQELVHRYEGLLSRLGPASPDESKDMAALRREAERGLEAACRLRDQSGQAPG